MRKVVILGVTGSIGTNAVELIKANPDLFQIVGIAANLDSDKLQKVANEFNLPDSHVIKAKTDGFNHVINLARGIDKNGKSFAVDVVLNSITGSIGLEPTLACLEANIDLALANKESLIAGGSLIRKLLNQKDSKQKHLGMLSQINPVDSEHSAIWQCLENNNSKDSAKLNIRKLLLTASGGPFSKASSKEDLKNITPEQALNHPTWNMGKVVTTNSATLMNKGLELIEASYLFDVKPEDISVVIQHQSIIHSMIEYNDGSVIAQLSTPDMKLPIALGLNTVAGNTPKRVRETTKPLDFTVLANLTFSEPKHDLFPFINMAKHALKSGPLYPTVMNAINECAVDDFHDGKICFLDIFSTVEQKLQIFNPSDFSNNPDDPTLEEIKGVEFWARN